MPVTRDEVVNAYRYILGRYPESEEVVESWAGLAANFSDLCQNTLKSLEFERRYAALKGGMAGKAIKGKEISISMCEINGHEFFWCGDSKAKDPLNECAKCGQTYLGGGLLPVAQQEGGCFLDIGANIGGISLALAACGWKGYAVEASSVNAGLLKRSIMLNDFDIKCIDKGIWSESGKLYFKGIGPWGTIVRKPEENVTEIQVMSLDDLWAEELQDCQQLDFIKMDIEGSEVEALAGGRKLLEHFGFPPIFVEANAWTLALVDDKTTADLIRMAESYGYLAYRLQDGVWKKYTAEAFLDEFCTDYMLVHPSNRKEYIRFSEEAFSHPGEEESAEMICENLSQEIEYWGQPKAGGLLYQKAVAICCSLKQYGRLAARADVSALLGKIKEVAKEDALMMRAVGWF